MKHRLLAMSTNALLDHDFGSESEDDNFNPAPADQSDNEDAVEPYAENGLDTEPDDHITKNRRHSVNGLKAEDDKDLADGGGRPRPFSGPGLAEEDEADELNSQGGDDDEEEDDEEDDDDEEAVVSVFPLVDRVLNSIC